MGGLCRRDVVPGCSTTRSGWTNHSANFSHQLLPGEGERFVEVAGGTVDCFIDYLFLWFFAKIWGGGYHSNMKSTLFLCCLTSQLAEPRCWWWTIVIPQPVNKGEPLTHYRYPQSWACQMAGVQQGTIHTHHLPYAQTELAITEVQG